MTPRPRCLPPILRARFAALMLDHQLATGCETERDPALRRRAAIVSSDRARRRLAAGLRRVLTQSPRQPYLSAAVAADAEALEIARPALEQLERTIREQTDLRPRGLALAQLLLTDPESALYRPDAPETLHEAARAALLAMLPDRSRPAVDAPQATQSLMRVA